MFTLQIPYAVARDARLGRRELLVYGVYLGLLDNRRPPPSDPPIDVSDVAHFAGVEESEVNEAFERLVELDLADYDEDRYYEDLPSLIVPYEEREPLVLDEEGR